MMIREKPVTSRCHYCMQSFDKNSEGSETYKDHLVKQHGRSWDEYQREMALKAHIYV